ncbi:MAG: putative membrane protein YgcG [Myxococcota bacterium]|jgi:uncharacterized membrane protein YgcG
MNQPTRSLLVLSAAMVVFAGCSDVTHHERIIQDPEPARVALEDITTDEIQTFDFTEEGLVLVFDVAVADADLSLTNIVCPNDEIMNLGAFIATQVSAGRLDLDAATHFSLGSVAPEEMPGIIDDGNATCACDYGCELCPDGLTVCAFRCPPCAGGGSGGPYPDQDYDEHTSGGDDFYGHSPYGADPAPHESGGAGSGSGADGSAPGGWNDGSYGGSFGGGGGSNSGGGPGAGGGDSGSGSGDSGNGGSGGDHW